MQIGAFKAIDGGYSGRLRTLTLDLELRIAPASAKDNEKAPDWRIFINGAAPIEVGAGWTHKSANAGIYVAVQLDCPALARSIRANLVRSNLGDDAYALLWSPRVRRAKGQ